jgi:ABC-type transport system involved in multi-copper enzyme maturation permease subunit
MDTRSESHVAWPEPVAPPGPLRGFWTLARFSTEQLFFSRRTLLVGLIAVLPVLFAAAVTVARGWVSLSGPSSPAGLYSVLYSFFYLHVLLLLVPLLYGGGLISDEVEGQTLSCLLTRPVSKAVVLLAKLAAYSAVAAMLAGPSLVLSYTLLNATQGGLSALTEGAQSLLQDLAVLGAGLLVYGAVFGLFGLALKRPLLIGVLYGIWESIFAYVPGFFHRLTVLHHLHANSRIASEYGWILALVRESTPAGEARLTLAVVFLIAVAAAIVVFRRREFRQQGADNP